MTRFFRRRGHDDDGNNSRKNNSVIEKTTKTAKPPVFNTNVNRRAYFFFCGILLAIFLFHNSPNTVQTQKPIPLIVSTAAATTTTKLESSTNTTNRSSSLVNSNACWHLSVPSFQFHPKQFMEDGPGQPYLQLYQKQLEQKKRLFEVRFVVYNLNKTCQPVYYHVHKNGGTSMNVMNNPQVDAFYTPKERVLGKEAFSNKAMQVMLRIQKAQKQQQQQQQQESSSLQAQQVDNMPLFTFLRDPVPRFLSSIGQALINGNRQVRLCSKASKGTLALLECILTKIHTQQSFLDEHLVPQAFELYAGIMGLDLHVTVMDLSHVPKALKGLFGSSYSSLAAVTHQRKGPDLIERFKMNRSVTLPPTMIHQICQLYRVDVLLLRMTQVSQTICKED